MPKRLPIHDELDSFSVMDIQLFTLYEEAARTIDTECLRMFIIGIAKRHGIEVEDLLNRLDKVDEVWSRYKNQQLNKSPCKKCKQNAGK